MGVYQQISQGMDGAEPPFDQWLEEAANVVRREKETTGNTEPSEGYKRKQIDALESFAKTNSLWLDNYHLLGKYLAGGGENEVYAKDDGNVYKLNNFEYAGDDLSNFFDRIRIHNFLFPNVSYKLIGFALNSQGEVCAILVQSFVESEREATEEEIADYMQLMGFKVISYDEFHSDDYEIFDSAPNNVLVGKDGVLYFIDTQIRIK